MKLGVSFKILHFPVILSGLMLLIEEWVWKLTPQLNNNFENKSEIEINFASDTVTKKKSKSSKGHVYVYVCDFVSDMKQ